MEQPEREVHRLFAMRVLKLFKFYGLRRHPTFSKKSQLIVVYVLKKSIKPHQKWSFVWKYCLSLLKKTSQPLKKLKFCMTKWQKRYQKEHPAQQKLNFCQKKLSFFTQKYLPAPQKTEILQEKMTKKWQKSSPKRARTQARTWSFAWKIENRPTYGDFEKKNLDPQLHQIFKPIRKFSCTFLPI